MKEETINKKIEEFKEKIQSKEDKIKYLESIKEEYKTLKAKLTNLDKWVTVSARVRLDERAKLLKICSEKNLTVSEVIRSLLK